MRVTEEETDRNKKNKSIPQSQFINIEDKATTSMSECYNDFERWEKKEIRQLWLGYISFLFFGFFSFFIYM